jgi:hypothetical protein
VIDGGPPPTPERIARWEEHEVRLLAVRTATDRVINAQEIVARSQAPATSALRRKGVGILLTGLGMIAASVIIMAIEAATDVHAFGRRLLALLIVGIGTAFYGIFQIVFG